MKADKMIDNDSTYSGSAVAIPWLRDSVNYNVIGLISVVSILILLLLSEGNILLGIIS
jgi:hypothetical protein